MRKTDENIRRSAPTRLHSRKRSGFMEIPEKTLGRGRKSVPKLLRSDRNRTATWGNTADNVNGITCQCVKNP